MTAQQIRQRLLQAALTETTDYPVEIDRRLLDSLEHARPSATRPIYTILRYTAAIFAIVLLLSPLWWIYSPRPSFTDTCRDSSEAQRELQSALALIVPISESSDLLNLVH